jgi:rubredoxin-NAD+ reductase
MDENKNIVIIGSGMAGYTLLREIRKLDPDIDITLICADNGDFYSKPMLSNALDKNKTPDSLVMQSAEKMVATQHFELINKTFVRHIDSSAQTIHSDDKSWHYQSLVLATGAKPVRLPIAGDGAQDMISINHLDHYRHFYQKLDKARHIAIIGPGLIGCELANDIISIHKHVSIIGPDPWPISNLLPEAAGLFLQQKLEASGINFYLQDTVQSINKNADGYVLQLQQKESIKADLVLSAVGLRANVELAADTDLLTKTGFVTDQYLRSSLEHIYALGDCAQVKDYHLPYILPIMQCARALAKTLTGEKTAVSYPAMPVAIKTPACPVVVAPPPSTQTSEWQVTQTKDGVKALCYEQEQLTGFALVGESVAEKQTLVKTLPVLL